MIRRQMVNPRPANPLVILTKVRIQSQAVPPPATLGPDVRQDDGRL